MKSNVLALTCLLVSVCAPVAQPGSRPKGGLGSLLDGQEMGEFMRSKVDGLTTELGWLFGELPMNELQRIDVRDEAVEFVFGFKGEHQVEIPTTRRFVLNERKGKLEVSKNQGLKIRCAPRLRFVLVDGEFRMREGDIEARKCFCWWDLSVRTETRASQVIRDSKGRPYVQVDEAGVPLRDADGRLTFERSHRWLVIEAKGKRYEWPLPLTF